MHFCVAESENKTVFILRITLAANGSEWLNHPNAKFDFMPNICKCDFYICCLDLTKLEINGRKAGFFTGIFTDKTYELQVYP